MHPSPTCASSSSRVAEPVHRAGVAAVAAVLMAAAHGSAAADGSDAGDPLHAPACREALRALEQAERDAPDPAGRAASAVPGALAAARRQVARICLAGPPDPPVPPLTRLQPPLAMPPVSVPPMRPPAGVPGPSIAVPTPRAPVTITACDPTGCWASDGSRLQRAGPQLLGPRGPCTTAGALLNCP